MDTGLKSTLVLGAVVIGVGFVGYRLYKNYEEEKAAEERQDYYRQRYRRPLRRLRRHRNTLFRYSPLRSKYLRRYSMYN